MRKRSVIALLAGVILFVAGSCRPVRFNLQAAGHALEVHSLPNDTYKTLVRGETKLGIDDNGLYVVIDGGQARDLKLIEAACRRLLKQ